MSVSHRSSCSALVLALAFAFSTAGPASARQNARKTQRSIPPLSVEAPATTPARYFTINQVLAKREAHRAPGSALQFANTTTTMTDAPAAGGHLLPTGEPFGLSTFRAPEGLLWVKWRGIQEQLKSEAGEIALCRTDGETCSPAARRFTDLVDHARSREGRARIEAVNRAVNSAIRYTSDDAQHGVADRWSAPLATLATGRGDCEDYVIAKYAVLRAAGVPANDLRVLLVRDRAVRQDHAVLAVRDSGRWLVLDNRHTTLSETPSLPQFTPLFAIDHQGVSLFAAPYAAARSAPDVEPAGMVPLTAVSGSDASPASSGAATTPYLL